MSTSIVWHHKTNAVMVYSVWNLRSTIGGVLVHQMDAWGSMMFVKLPMITVVTACSAAPNHLLVRKRRKVGVFLENGPQKVLASNPVCYNDL